MNETLAVHALEHGAVWISYGSDLDPEAVQSLTELVGDPSHVLLSPQDGQENAVTATAWGTQLTVEDAEDPRLER